MTRLLPSRTAALLPCLLVSTVLVVPLEAAVVPADSPLRQKEFRHPGLYIPNLERPVGELGPALAGRGLDLVRLGAGPGSAFFDWRGARWASLILSQPLIPGDGKGNTLGTAKVGHGEIWKAVSDYVASHQAELRVDPSELATPRIGIFDGGSLVQLHAQRVVDGIKVRDSGFTAIINHGNLVLLGLQNWGSLDATPSPKLAAAAAEAAAAAYVSPFKVSSYEEKARLELIPLSAGESVATVAAGFGYEYRLVWVVTAKIAGDLGTWESLVDATTGRLIAFQDTNQYVSRKIMGGVYPISNDQKPPDGLEQSGWPMPYADITAGGPTFYTDSGGSMGCAVGTVTSSLSGKFMKMVDTCGAINESIAAGDLDLGFGPNPLDTDCVVPPGHSAGDTKSSRSGFYEMNRIKEQARGHLPGNVWLDDQLTSNMNIPQACNAFWDGNAVNFFKSSGTCRNTGEIAAIFDHEWGHGLDNNGVNPNIASPGENIADTTAILRLNTSCTGRGFFKNQVCGGYGDPCVGTPATGCTGVRDLDFAQHVSGLPHGIDWILSNCGGGGGPCNREVHCEGQPMGEVSWDLQFRDLRAAPYNYDENTALELATRLFYLGQQAVTDYYTCNPAGGGCGATGGYMLVLAADDDNGDINDGTPHMTAIRAAFERHQMHCATPAPVDSGCAGAPATAPTVNVTPMDKGAQVSWTAVGGAASYNVYRTEGVNGCSFGKVKVGETTGLSFQDQGLQNGRTYYYSVVPVGSNSSCFGPMSACATVVPVDGFNLAIQQNTSITVTRGDNDSFLDNCETGTVGFTVENNGTGTLTNVQLIAITPLTHPQTVINTPLPQVLAPTLADCATAGGSFSFSPQGMNFGDTTQLEIEVTADELNGATRTLVISVGGVESDTQFVASRTYDYETDYSGWTVVDGTYNREQPGANGTAFHLHSTTLLDDQCDVARSPEMRLKANSTLSLWNRYQTEPPVPIPYDRANVGVVDLDADTRTTIVPNGGRLYDLPPGTPNGACVTGGEAGWAGDQQTFAISTWDSAATNPGGVFTDRRVQVEVAYGTDAGLALEGFHFDEVTITNFDELIPDAQNNQCGTGVSGLSITNVSVPEGNSGSAVAGFTIFLSPPNAQTVTVDYATADGSATTADGDYQATSGTATFPPGTTSVPVPVTVFGDTKFEGNETFFVNLSNAVGANIGDAQGQGTILNDDGVGGGAAFVTELFHGYVEQDNLAAVGGAANTDFYSISQKPYSSYEILVDATSGDIGPTLDLDRIAADGTTVLQSSAAVGQGFSRNLRWVNNTAAETNTESIRVRSTACGTDCGTDDVYQIHAFETTFAIPRFNNFGTQVTVLLLQNPTSYPIAGTIYFWDVNGVQVGNQPFNLTGKNTLVLNTATVPGAAGVGGTVTVTHDGRYGDLIGKTVALEPATGFSFDSPMLPRVKVN
jgi:trimeric autotransporter adhesin